MLRVAEDFVSRGVKVSTQMYNSFYTTVFSACCLNKLHRADELLYNVINEKMVALIMDGTLHRITGTKRDRFVRFVGNVFKYLDRFYVPRCQQPDGASIVQRVSLSL